MNNLHNEAELLNTDENALLVNNNQNGENNVNNINENNNSQNNSGLKSSEIFEISKDFFPSISLICLLLFSLSLTDKYCDESFPLILKGSMYLQFGFLLKSISLFIFLTCINTDYYGYLKYSIKAFDYIWYITYYIFIIYASNLYKSIPNSSECLRENPFQTVVIFSIITLGLIDILKNIFNFILILIGFPVLVYYFFKDPRDFIQKYGVDPELIDNWPTVSANDQHTTECAICCDEISVGQQIMVLNCSGKHYYHGPCIKEWLKQKVNCPLCKSSNVF